MLLDTIYSYVCADLMFKLNKNINDIDVFDIEKELINEQYKIFIEKSHEGDDLVYYKLSNDFNEYLKIEGKKTKKIFLMPHFIGDVKNSIFNNDGELDVNVLDVNKKSVELKARHLSFFGKIYNGNTFNTSYVSLNTKEAMLLTYFTYMSNKASFRITNDRKVINYSLLPKFNNKNDYYEYVKFFNKKNNNLYSNGIVGNKRINEKGIVDYYHPIVSNFISKKILKFNYGIFYSILSYIELIYEYMFNCQQTWNIDSFYLISSNGDVRTIKIPKLYVELASDGSLFSLVECFYQNSLSLNIKLLREFENITVANFIKTINKFNHRFEKNSEILNKLLIKNVEVMNNKNLLNELKSGVETFKKIIWVKIKNSHNKNEWELINKKYYKEIVELQSRANNVKENNDLYKFIQNLYRKTGYSLPLNKESLDSILNLNNDELNDVVELIKLLLSIKIVDINVVENDEIKNIDDEINETFVL
jgi:hypothetical protein